MAEHTEEDGRHTFKELAFTLIKTLVDEHDKVVASMQAEIQRLQDTNGSQSSAPKISKAATLGSRRSVSKEMTVVCQKPQDSLERQLPNPSSTQRVSSQEDEDQELASPLIREIEKVFFEPDSGTPPGNPHVGARVAGSSEERESLVSQVPRSPYSSQSECSSPRRSLLSVHKKYDAPNSQEAENDPLPDEPEPVRERSFTSQCISSQPASLRPGAQSDGSFVVLPVKAHAVVDFPNLLGASQPNSRRSSPSKGSRNAFALMSELEDVMCCPPADQFSSLDDQSPRRRQRRSSGAALRRGSSQGSAHSILDSGKPLQTDESDDDGQSTSLKRYSEKVSSRTSAAFHAWPLWEFVQNEWESASAHSDASIQPLRLSRCSKAAQESGSNRGLLRRLCQKAVIDPDSIKRIHWMGLNMVVITYDMLVTPLVVFDVFENVVVRSVALFTAGYWTIDCCLSFFVGFHDKSCRLEMDPQKTASHYARNWMCFDLFLLITDWTFLVLLESNQAGNTGFVKLMRLMRAMRLATLLRIVRIPKSARALKRVFGNSEYVSLTLGICSQLFGILILNHIIACTWCLIGESLSPGWVEMYEKGSPAAVRYITALHWSLTQFTPATMHVQPQHPVERIFAVAVLLFALVSFSSFVSSITNLMTHLRNLKSVENKQFLQLDGYLKEYNISTNLGVRIRRYLEHITHKKGGMREEDVELLEKLSQPLQIELRYEVHYPLLSKHPFFLCFAHTNQAVMQRVCSEALKVVHLSAGDSLFTTADAAASMYFVSNGVLIYTLQQTKQPETVKLGMWFCEAVLWTPWEHRGDMRALIEASLTQLEVDKFHRILNKNRSALRFPAAYAMEVVETLSSLPLAADLTDLDYKIFDHVPMVRTVIDSDVQAHAQKHALLNVLNRAGAESNIRAASINDKGFLPRLVGGLGIRHITSEGNRAELILPSSSSHRSEKMEGASRSPNQVSAVAPAQDSAQDELPSVVPDA
eukprot:TRINITY_DN1213_c0_g1_i1.p1 TRINITY_DN1213_c0_g1~~TRINITY_DN1213_c0_g1_i1.p1  ORF type:complete len:994 (+),score=151.92 TRINITY_DN1213_c0_g1_i1:36-2984(+)